MRKLINTSFYYAILALIGGVFFREFTKFNHFTGKTTLAFVHLHLFALGMLFFLLLTVLDKQFSLTTHKHFRLFYNIYNLGLHIAVASFIWRGITQVLTLELSSGMDAAISGVSGLGHMLLGAGLIFFFIILKVQALPVKTK